MLSYFRINDPLRIITVLFLLFLLRLPVLLSGGPITVNELNWMLVGERLAEGNIIYNQLIDNISPLASFVTG